MPESATPEILSPSELRRFAAEICAGEAEIFSELIGDCQKDIDYQLDQLREARKSESWKDFSRAAHSIKSAARTFGSPLVKQLSLDLEQSSANGVGKGELGTIDAKTEELVSACESFKTKLQEVADDPGPFLS